MITQICQLSDRELKAVLREVRNFFDLVGGDPCQEGTDGDGIRSPGGTSLSS